MSSFDNRGPTMLHTVVDDVCHSHTPVCLMLAKTILCLGCLCHHPNQSFSRSTCCFRNRLDVGPMRLLPSSSQQCELLIVGRESTGFPLGLGPFLGDLPIFLSFPRLLFFSFLDLGTRLYFLLLC